MAEHSTTPFLPDYAVHPGETVSESLEAAGMTQLDLAERTGLSRKTINRIVNGHDPITSETALRLEMVFRVPAAFWSNLQSNYDETVTRLADNKRRASQLGWLAGRKMPVKELMERNAIPPAKVRQDQLREVLKFFGVTDPERFASLWDAIERGCSAVIPKHRFGAFASWLRLGELAAVGIVAEPYDGNRLAAFLDRSSFLTSSRARFVQEELVAEVSRCGIALVFIPCFKGAEVLSAVRWMTPTKVLVLVGADTGKVADLRPLLLRALESVSNQKRREIILEVPTPRSSAGEGSLRRLPLRRGAPSTVSPRRAVTA